jgi:hypothetical protein
MTDPRIERLAAQVLEAISDPRVCGQGANALRNMIRQELRRAAPNANEQTNTAIEHASGQIAGGVEDLCRGLPPDVRAVGVVVAAAGAIYGVSRMPEEEILQAIAGVRAKVIDSRLTPLFGERPSVNAEARWQQQLFGQPGSARLFATDLGGNAVAGGSWTAPLQGGSMELGANTGGGGTVYFRLKLSW